MSVKPRLGRVLSLHNIQIIKSHIKLSHWNDRPQIQTEHHAEKIITWNHESVYPGNLHAQRDMRKI